MENFHPESAFHIAGFLVSEIGKKFPEKTRDFLNILVLARNKTDIRVQFIHASGEEFFKKSINSNILENRQITRIMEKSATKENVPQAAETVSFENIAENGYNLSVSAYVEPKDTREMIDIKELNAEMKTTAAGIDRLRSDIDAIIAEIEA